MLAPERAALLLSISGMSSTVPSIQQQAEHLGHLEYVLSKEADQRALAKIQEADQEALTKIQAEQSLRLAQQSRRPLLEQQVSQLEGTLYSLLHHGVFEGEPLGQGWLVGEGNTRIFADDTGDVQIARAGRLRGFSRISINLNLIFGTMSASAILIPLATIMGVVLLELLGVNFSQATSDLIVKSTFLLMAGAAVTVPSLSSVAYAMLQKWPSLSWRTYNVHELPDNGLAEVEALVTAQLDKVRGELSKRHLQLLSAYTGRRMV